MPLDNLGQFYEVRYHEPWTAISPNRYRCYLLQFADGEKIWSNGKDIMIHWPVSSSHLAVHSLAITHVAHMESVDITTSFIYAEDEQHGLYKSKMDISVGMSLIVKIDDHNEPTAVEWDLITPVETREATPETTPTMQMQGVWGQGTKDFDVALDGPTDGREGMPLAPPTPLAQMSKKGSKLEGAHGDNGPKLTRYPPKKSASLSTEYGAVEDIGPATQAGCRIPPLLLRVFASLETSKEDDGQQRMEKSSVKPASPAVDSSSESLVPKAEAGYSNLQSSAPAISVGVGIPPIPIEVLKSSQQASKSPNIEENGHFGLDGCFYDGFTCKNHITVQNGQTGLMQGDPLVSGKFHVQVQVPSVLQQAISREDKHSVFSFNEDHLPKQARIHELNALIEAAAVREASAQKATEDMLTSWRHAHGALPSSTDRESIQSQSSYQSFLAPCLDVCTPNLNIETFGGALKRQSYSDDDFFEVLNNTAHSPANISTPKYHWYPQQSIAEQSAGYRMETLSLGSTGEYPPVSDQDNPCQYAFPNENDNDLMDELTEEQVRSRDEEYYDSLLEFQLEYSYYDIDDRDLPPAGNSYSPKKENEAQKPFEQLNKQSAILSSFEELNSKRKKDTKEARVIGFLGQH